jgi:predicted nucleic acid-binding protein
MGIICDTSVLIAAEKRRFDLAAFLRAHPDDEFWLAAITASELLHGVD